MVGDNNKQYSRLSDAFDDSLHAPGESHELGGPWPGAARQLSQYSRHFEPNKQSWRLFREQISRLAITIVLVAFYVATLKIYQDEGNVRHADKVLFNTITTILSLSLGLNFLEAFKDMAKVLRWRVLANRESSVRETDLILGGESLMKLLSLMWESKRKPLTLSLCSLWIMLNLLAQASVAMIGLTYSMDRGTDSSGIITHSGTSEVASLECYSNGNSCPKEPETPQSIAHAYGEVTQSYKSCAYGTDDDIKKANQSCTYFQRNDALEYAYRFREYNPADSTRTYPFLSDRIVKASPGRCYQFNIDANSVYPIDGTDGIAGTFVYPFHNETYNSSLAIPKADAAFDATSYVWNGTSPPQNDTEQSCGPRCVWLYAFQSIGVITHRPDLVFQCPITVEDVSGVSESDTVRNVSDEIARLAAASIALSGRYTNPDGPTRVWQQYQLYPWGSYWETNDLTAQEVGARMSQYAIGSLATMANLNPLISIQGTVPSLGYSLNVEWKWVITLAIGIMSAHMLLVALLLLISRPIVVGGDSNLVVARLLQGLVGKLDGRGSLLEGEELAKAVEKNSDVGKRKVTYGVRKSGTDGEEDSFVLEISGDVEGGRKRPNGKFPEQVYL